MKILIFGGRGYMGRQFLRIYPDALLPSADIADHRAVADALERERPDVVINAAGRTGVPNVDWCEDHKLETLRSNVTGPLVLLEECQKRGIYLVHLSSGCIYEGWKKDSKKLKDSKDSEDWNTKYGWTEEDEPNFTGSFYSRTKAWSEKALREFPVLILRLRMPFDGTPHPRNLITKLAKFDRVLDVENSITCLTDFLAATRILIDRHSTGIYNVVNDGAISPYRIAELYREMVDPSFTFERLILGSLAQAIRGKRSNCILSTAKLKGEGIAMRPVEAAVRSALLELKNSSSVRAEVTDMSNICVQC